MSSCARITTRVHVHPDLVNQDSSAPRLHHEISNAIKRQNQTSGIDYLKIQYPNRTMVGGNKTRKPDNGKLHNLTMEFPEVGFPSINHRLPKQNSQTVKVKKKVTLLGVDVLSRSQSSVDLPMPGFQEKEKASEPNAVPNTVNVTDLTCLQFADTLFTPSNSLHTGLFGFAMNKVKYMDYLEECMTTKEKPIHKESEVKEKRDKITERINAYKIPRVTKSVKSSSSLQKDSKSDKTPKPKVKEMKTNIEKSRNKDNCVKASEKSQLEEDSRHSNNRKSILKQGNISDSERDGTCAYSDVTIKKEISVKPKNKVIKNDLPQPVIKRNKQNIDSAVCVTVTASATRRNGYTTCGVTVVNGNGRSVRFNKSDEIFEFTPSEPIRVK